MVKQAFKDSYSWNKKFFFSSISTTAATIWLLKDKFQKTLSASLLWGMGILAVFFIARFIINIFSSLEDLSEQVQQKDEKIDTLTKDKDKRKNLHAGHIYGEAILFLKDAFAKMHYVRKKSDINNEELAITFVYFCDQLKLFFEKKTSTECAVSLKIVKSNPNGENVTEDTEVITICRDSTSKKKRNYHPEIKHKIFTNTCFNQIFHKIDSFDKSFYINNNLPDDKYYENTSSEVWGNLPAEATTADLRLRHWKLPYKSQLVVPICPIISDNGERKKEFLGFLTVDSSGINTFHYKYDVGMLQGAADGIYDLIKINNHL
jgi:hypothetical protein